MTEINVMLFRRINDLGKEYSFLNPVFVFVAEYMVYFLALGVVLFWFTRLNRHRIMVISAVVSFVLAEIIAKLVGQLHSNNQPFAELSHVNKLVEKAVDNSFPSDHTILFFTFCCSFLFFRKRGGILWIALAFLVGLSRIWVGVHYPADVLVGAVIGFMSSTIAYQVVPKLRVVNQILGIYEKGEKLILPAKSNSKNF